MPFPPIIGKLPLLSFSFLISCEMLITALCHLVELNHDMCLEEINRIVR